MLLQHGHQTVQIGICVSCAVQVSIAIGAVFLIKGSQRILQGRIAFTDQADGPEGHVDRTGIRIFTGGIYISGV